MFVEQTKQDNPHLQTCILKGHGTKGKGDGEEKGKQASVRKCSYQWPAVMETDGFADLSHIMVGPCDL